MESQIEEAAPAASRSAAMAAADEERSNVSILDSMGEELIRIVGPVSSCMLLVVLLVSSLSSNAPPPLTNSSPDSSQPWGQITTAFVAALGFVGAVTAMTFLMVLLFYLRCTSCLKSYLAFSTLSVLLLLGAAVSLSLLSRFRLPLDAATYALLLLNFAGVGVVAVFAAASVPIALNQAYLVLIGVLTAYWFTLLPEWTTWALLVAMSVYDLAAVLLPGGPLRLLVEMAMSRNEQIPALVYEARPVNPQPGQNWRLWHDRTNRDAAANAGERSNLDDATVNSGNVTLAEVMEREEGRDLEAAANAEMRAPLMQQQGREENGGEEDDGIGLSSSVGIKLGLGDFIFYSVLVGRAAMYDYMAVYACYLAIIAGLGITLLLLAFFRKALPALPVSIMLGVVFYVLTRALLEVFVMQCSTNLLMF